MPPPPARPPPLSLNRVHLSPWVLASHEFNEAPQPLAIGDVRAENRRLFHRLDELPDPAERGRTFHEYLSVKFALHLWDRFDGSTRRSLRNSYLRVLNGWGADSNAASGAVLKGWVESRFGIPATYHRHPIPLDDPGEARHAFECDRTNGHGWSNAIEAQLDLLYTFCQYELTRRFPDETHRTLYRGTNDPHEHPLIAQRGKRERCVRLNNLVSFTSDRERAWEFGSSIWEARVPLVKILFFSGLLSPSLLGGEAEYLVIGGEFWVREHLY